MKHGEIMNRRGQESLTKQITVRLREREMVGGGVTRGRKNEMGWDPRW